MASRTEFVNDVYERAIKLGIPEPQARLAASQAALESNYGKSAPGNNYFGMKAGSSWSGPTKTLKTSEVLNGKTVSVKDKFRAYDDLDASLSDWWDRLQVRWPDAASATSYEDAISGLKLGTRLGYATDPNYSSKLNYAIAALPPRPPGEIPGGTALDALSVFGDDVSAPSQMAYSASSPSQTSTLMPAMQSSLRNVLDNPLPAPSPLVRPGAPSSSMIERGPSYTPGPISGAEAMRRQGNAQVIGGRTPAGFDPNSLQTLNPPAMTVPGASMIERSPSRPSPYDTKLTPNEERAFQAWKATYAPNDSGTDYDLRGAFKAGLTPDPVSGHWPDMFKKPNHPTFSIESQYASAAPSKAGRWTGDTFVPVPGTNYGGMIERGPSRPSGAPEPVRSVQTNNGGMIERSPSIAAPAPIAPTTKTVANPAYAAWEKQYGSVASSGLGFTYAGQDTYKAPVKAPPAPPKTITVTTPATPAANPLGDALGWLGGKASELGSSAMGTIQGVGAAIPGAIDNAKGKIINGIMMSPEGRGLILNPMIGAIGKSGRIDLGNNQVSALRYNHDTGEFERYVRSASLAGTVPRTVAPVGAPTPITPKVTGTASIPKPTLTTTATGKTVASGTSYTRPSGISYTVQPDGSIVNSYGRVTAPAKK